MHQLITPAALLLACSLAMSPAMAQDKDAPVRKEKKETVIINQSTKNGKTVVEIKDGAVFVNGDKIADVETDEKGVTRKVIITNGSGPNFHFDDDMPKPPKAMLGVMIEPESARKGALLRDVSPNSAAEKAGLKKGDLITAVNGKPVKNARELADEIGDNYKPGDKISIQYQREGKSHSTDANLVAANPPQTIRQFRIHPELDRMDMPNLMRSIPMFAEDMMEPSPKLGLSVEDRNDGEGVQVLTVKPGSAAASAGIREGDVITRLNQEKLGSVDELQMMMRNFKGGEKVRLQYQRAGKNSSTELTLPRNLKKKDL